MKAGQRSWGVALGLALVWAGAADAADAPCGWALPAGQALAFKPDRSVDPRSRAPLPRPPAGAVALYCRRDSMTVEPNDFRILRELRLPYIVEHGGKFGVLQTPPAIVLNYHTEGGRFVRGRAPAPEEQKTRT